MRPEELHMTQAPVVILIHGIRTSAWWQNRIAHLIETKTDATVIPIKYGYFDVLRFWCPFGICRAAPIEKLRQQIEGVARQYADRPLIVFAHSYGTYALTRVILENPYFRFDRIILCGSVVPSSFDWRAVEDQIRGEEKRNAIVNECGTRDIWPVLAQSGTWGYGATGTFGFGTFNVRDRFHDLPHSGFFSNEFVEKYWIPLVKGEKVVFSDQDAAGAGTPAWFAPLRLPLKWLPLAAVLLAAFTVFRPLTAEAQCDAGLELIGQTCVDRASLDSRGELNERVSTLVMQVNRTLDLKGSELFPLMDSYTLQPSQEKWEAVLTNAERLLGIIETGIDEIGEYNARFVETDEGVFYVLKDGKIAVSPDFVHAFDGVRSHFKGRSTIIGEMRSTNGLPNTAKMAEWRNRLDVLHRDLENALRQISNLLRTA